MAGCTRLLLQPKPTSIGLGTVKPQARVSKTKDTLRGEVMMNQSNSTDLNLSPLSMAVRRSLYRVQQPATWLSLGLVVGAQTAVASPAVLPEKPGLSPEHIPTAVQRELVIVDAGVENAQTLINGVPAESIVAKLPEDQDPITAIGRLLHSHPDVSVVHLLSHGDVAELHLAGQTIDISALQARADVLQGWFRHRDRTPEIVLYGCDVAAGEPGHDLIHTLAELTGAVVSASIDPTGNPVEGGDWIFERSTGLAARAPIFGEQARAEFSGLLGTLTVINNNDGGAGSLRQAVLDANAAAGADEILFDPGLNGQTITLTSGDIVIDDELTITGPGSDQLTVSGDDSSRIFSISSSASAVTISGLTLSDGSTDDDGGAIYASDVDLTIQNSVIQDSYAYNDGGGIFQDEGMLTIADSSITGNSTYDDGGGIAVEGEVVMTITGSYITGNTANDDAGGISHREGTLTITESTISGNTADGDAGGVLFDSTYDTNAQLQITGSTISGNESSGEGGGVAIEITYYAGTLDISDSTISGNTARRGGGISLYAEDIEQNADYAGTLTIYGSMITENTAFYSGGGIFIYGEGDISDTLIESTTISNNDVETDNRGGDGSFGVGGGIAFFNDYGYGTLTILDSTISGNTAPFGGGGVMVNFETYGSPVLIEDSTINGNTTSYGIGGGVLLINEEGISDAPYGSLTIRNSTISGNNAAGFGGGLAAFFYYYDRSADSSANLSGSGKAAGQEKSEARGYGGGPPLLSEIVIENTTFSGNSAIGPGGGIGLRAPGSRGLAMRNSTISGNSSGSGGGGISLEAEYLPFRGDGPYFAITLDASFVTLADNVVTPLDRGQQASYAGGGILLNAYATAEFTNSIIADNTAQNSNDVDGEITANFSLIEDDSGAIINGADNLTGIDPALDPLADNGGPTETHLPQEGSAVIDAGDPGFAPPPNTDQRGFLRVVNDRVDMGAVEVQEAGDPIIGLSTNDFDFGTIALGVGEIGIVTLSNTGTADVNVTGITDPLPPFSFVTTRGASGSCATPPFTLVPSESCNLQVQFDPTVPGNFISSFDIISNAPSSPDTVTVRGSAQPPLVVPTLNRIGLVLMAGLMAVAGLFGWRRRRDRLDKV